MFKEELSTGTHSSSAHPHIWATVEEGEGIECVCGALGIRVRSICLSQALVMELLHKVDCLN